MTDIKKRFVRIALVIALAAAGGATASAQAVRERVDGVTNFGRVTDTYFRGGKVTAAGVESLKKLGVRTIVDLRDEPTPEEKAAAERAGITYLNFGMDGHATPDAAVVDRVLSILRDADAPVYVHCSAGKHRAGTLCALYRMNVQGWSKEQAWAEQQAFGFGPIQEHPELYAFVYEGGYTPTTAATAVGAPVATASAVAVAPEPAAETGLAGTPASASLSNTAGYLPLADVLARAKANGAAGEVLKVDLEYDVERRNATWDVTYSSGLEYEFHAVTGEFLGAKPKTPAKLATMVPIEVAGRDFVRVMKTATAKAGQPVQEMELKHVKGTPKAVFEVVFADGATVYYDAATGGELAGA